MSRSWEIKYRGYRILPYFEVLDEDDELVETVHSLPEAKAVVRDHIKDEEAMRDAEEMDAREHDAFIAECLGINEPKD